MCQCHIPREECAEKLQNGRRVLGCRAIYVHISCCLVKYPIWGAYLRRWFWLNLHDSRERGYNVVLPRWFRFFPYPRVCCVRGSVLRNRPTVRWLLFLAANRLKVIALLKMMLRSNLWWWSSEVRARSDLGLVWIDRKNICIQLPYYYTQNSLRYTKYFLASFVTIVSMNPFFLRAVSYMVVARVLSVYLPI